MAQQTSPQEHPHTDPRTNEPSEQTPFSVEEGKNQQDYPGKVQLHVSASTVTATFRTHMPLGAFHAGAAVAVAIRLIHDVWKCSILCGAPFVIGMLSDFQSRPDFGLQLL